MVLLQDFVLEFYVRKTRPTKRYVESLIEVLESQGLRLRIDDEHAPFFGDLSRDTHEKRAKLSREDAIERVVEEGGGGFSFVHNEVAFWIRIYPQGWPGNRERAKRLGESPDGEVALGSVAVEWPWVSDEQETRPRLQKTLELGRVLYSALKPIIGMGYLDEIDVTEASILRDGPRQLFRINFWGPEIAKRVDYSVLRDMPGIVIEGLPDGGVLIYVPPERLTGPDRVDLREAEILLGFRGNVDVGVYSCLIDYFARRRQNDPDGLARELGFREDIIEKGKRAFDAAGRNPDTWLGLPQHDWEGYAEEIARRVGEGQLIVDARDEEQLSAIFRDFVRLYRSS